FIVRDHLKRRSFSLKLFGSLSNLSFRRSTEKPGTKVPLEHDGGACGAKSAAVGNQSVDDMESCRHSPGYARSCEMYTHVGTVPRKEKQKKSFKGLKEKKTKAEEKEEGEERPQPAPASALPLPATLPPSRTSPLTSASDSCISDPAVEPLTSSEELKSKNDLETARKPSASNQDLGVVSQRVPVMSFKFSKEKFWLEPPSEKLRKQLEEELKLSGTNLKSHAWYHGCIPWQVSESLVVNHGDFLVRDSQSSPGDFVLTSHWEQKTLHFLVRKVEVQSAETYTRVQYSLESEVFDSLPALVHFYVGSRAALTRWSGAEIHRPVNRTLPLSYLETTFRTSTSSSSRQKELSNCSMGVEERVCPRSVIPSPSLPRCSDTVQPLTFPSGTLQRQHLDRPQPHHTHGSPSSDADGSCYTELYPGPQSYVERLRAEEGSGVVDPLRAEDGNVYFSPVVETVSCFKPSRYQSPLMAKENKPLEVGILRKVKELLAEVDPRTAAKHITKADCMVARILEVTPEVQRMMGVTSGMELLTLPHGQQLRLDLLERFQTMAIMLAVHVLGCTGTTEERACLLYKIIQIAAELKSTMGNMFGFAAVMRALELPQVSRLQETWMTLRQRHTEGAILYEKTLRPFMKSLNDGRESCPLSSTTFPHVLPLLTLMEKNMAVGEGTEPWETVEVGVEVVMFHLGAARTIAQLGGIYRSNAESKLQGFQEQAEVLELFLTDFQMRLLWGSRGAEEKQALRYSKFDQVLTALSNKLEPPVRRH
uniref:SH2 domain containing 3Cb n=1 Tax=Amphilophus citrinellus TaxID=61819 RepID=A0A3Q0RIX7_AMPCI